MSIQNPATSVLATRERLVKPDEFSSRLTIAADAYLRGNFWGAREIATFLLAESLQNADARMILEYAEDAIQRPANTQKIQENVRLLSKWRYELWAPKNLAGIPFGIRRADWFQLVSLLRGSRANGTLDIRGAEGTLATLDALKKTPIKLQVKPRTGLSELAVYLNHELNVPVRIADSASEIMKSKPPGDYFSTELKYPLNGAQALSHVLRNVRELSWTVIKSEILIHAKAETTEESAFEFGAIDVGDFIYSSTQRKSWPVKNSESSDAQPQNERKSSADEDGMPKGCLLESFCTFPPEVITATCKEVISQDSWKNSEFCIEFYQGVLVIRQHGHELLAIRELLAGIRGQWDSRIQLSDALDCGANNWSSVERALDRKMPENAKGLLGLGELILKLQTVMEVNVVFMGDPEEPVSTKKYSVQANASALDTLDDLREFCWSMEHGCIYIWNSEGPQKDSEQVYCYYDVSDLTWLDLQRRNNFKLDGRFMNVYWPAERPMDSARIYKITKEFGEWPIPTESEPQPAFTAEQLFQILEGAVDPGSWSSVNGDFRYVQSIGLLSIRQSRPNQSKIARLLKLMRRVS